MFVNPIIATIHNVPTDRWHPVLFVESPLPGPESPEKPVRHKSKMHHTTGFATRAESDNSAREELATQIPGARLELDTVFDWDGTGIPAMVHFFLPNADGQRSKPAAGAG